MSMTYHWTFEDDLTCCVTYLEFVFERTRNDKLKDLLDVLEEKLPHISRSSLCMKAKNIKQIAQEEGLCDHLEFPPLSQYSRQCHRAFLAATDILEKRMHPNG